LPGAKLQAATLLEAGSQGASRLGEQSLEPGPQAATHPDAVPRAAGLQETGVREPSLLEPGGQGQTPQGGSDPAERGWGVGRPWAGEPLQLHALAAGGGEGAAAKVFP
ncbi:MAG: hypothetical protein ACK55I_12120, partial [bacterium]